MQAFAAGAALAATLGAGAAATVAATPAGLTVPLINTHVHWGWTNSENHESNQAKLHEQDSHASPDSHPTGKGVGPGGVPPGRAQESPAPGSDRTPAGSAGSNGKSDQHKHDATRAAHKATP
jgi:hypothetical protein